MIGLAWMLMRSAGDKTIKAPPGAESPAGLPELPESLRKVSVAGRRYEVVMTSGQVIDRESTSRTNLVWVRTPDRRETPTTTPPTNSKCYRASTPFTPRVSCFPASSSRW